ncbi:MAG TPA: glycosyltransferase, partial [Mycobacteriales bacterium]|nr:glycosyltransferase [Mycobacteriales bacterium]
PWWSPWGPPPAPATALDRAWINEMAPHLARAIGARAVRVTESGALVVEHDGGQFTVAISLPEDGGITPGAADADRTFDLNVGGTRYSGLLEVVGRLAIAVELDRRASGLGIPLRMVNPLIAGVDRLTELANLVGPDALAEPAALANRAELADWDDLGELIALIEAIGPQTVTALVGIDAVGLRAALGMSDPPLLVRHALAADVPADAGLALADYGQVGWLRFAAHNWDSLSWRDKGEVRAGLAEAGLIQPSRGFAGSPDVARRMAALEPIAPDAVRFLQTNARRRPGRFPAPEPGVDPRRARLAPFDSAGPRRLADFVRDQNTGFTVEVDPGNPARLRVTPDGQQPFTVLVESGRLPGNVHSRLYPGGAEYDYRLRLKGGLDVDRSERGLLDLLFAVVEQHSDPTADTNDIANRARERSAVTGLRLRMEQYRNAPGFWARKLHRADLRAYLIELRRAGIDVTAMGQDIGTFVRRQGGRPVGHGGTPWLGRRPDPGEFADSSGQLSHDVRAGLPRPSRVPLFKTFLTGWATDTLFVAAGTAYITHHWFGLSTVHALLPLAVAVVNMVFQAATQRSVEMQNERAADAAVPEQQAKRRAQLAADAADREQTMSDAVRGALSSGSSTPRPRTAGPQRPDVEVWASRPADPSTGAVAYRQAVVSGGTGALGLAISLGSPALVGQTVLGAAGVITALTGWLGGDSVSARIISKAVSGGFGDQRQFDSERDRRELEAAFDELIGKLNADLAQLVGHATGEPTTVTRGPAADPVGDLLNAPVLDVRPSRTPSVGAFVHAFTFKWLFPGLLGTAATYPFDPIGSLINLSRTLFSWVGGAWTIQRFIALDNSATDQRVAFANQREPRLVEQDLNEALHEYYDQQARAMRTEAGAEGLPGFATEAIIDYVSPEIPPTGKPSPWDFVGRLGAVSAGVTIPLTIGFGALGAHLTHVPAIHDVAGAQAAAAGAHDAAAAHSASPDRVAFYGHIAAANERLADAYTHQHTVTAAHADPATIAAANQAVGDALRTATLANQTQLTYDALETQIIALINVSGTDAVAPIGGWIVNSAETAGQTNQRTYEARTDTVQVIDQNRASIQSLSENVSNEAGRHPANPSANPPALPYLRQPGERSNAEAYEQHPGQSAIDVSDPARARATVRSMAELITERTAADPALRAFLADHGLVDEHGNPAVPSLEHVDILLALTPGDHHDQVAGTIGFDSLDEDERLAETTVQADRDTVVIGRAAFDSPERLFGVVLTELIRLHQHHRGFDPHDLPNYHLAHSAKEAASLLTQQSKAQIADFATPAAPAQTGAPQRIVHFCNEFKGHGANEFGGVAKAATELAMAQAASGKKVVFITREPLPMHGEPTRRTRVVQVSENLTLIVAGLPEGATRELFESNEKAFLDLVGDAKLQAFDTWRGSDAEATPTDRRESFDPDMIHMHDWAGTRGAVELTQRLREQGRKVTLLSFVHGTHALENNGLITNPDIQHDEIDRIQRADAVVVAATKMVAEVRHLTRFFVHLSRFRIIPLIADVSHWVVDRGTIDRDAALTALLGPDHGITADDEIILVPGRIAPQKGDTDIVDALSRFVRPKTKVIFAGAVTNNEYGATLQNQVNESGLTANTFFTGRYNVADLIKLAPFADMALLASHWESFGLTALELAAAGVPIVATDQFPLVLDNAGTEHEVGVLIPRFSPDAIVDAVQAIRDDPEGAAERAVNAREVVLGPTYRADQIVKRYDDIYRAQPAAPAAAAAEIALPASNYVDSIRVHFLGARTDYPAAGRTLTLTHGVGTADPTTPAGRAPDGIDEHGPYWDVYLTGESVEGHLAVNLAIDNNGETIPLTVDTVVGQAISGRRVHVRKSGSGTYQLDTDGADVTARVNPDASDALRLPYLRQPGERSNAEAYEQGRTPETIDVSDPARARAAVRSMAELIQNAATTDPALRAYLADHGLLDSDGNPRIGLPDNVDIRVALTPGDAVDPATGTVGFDALDEDERLAETTIIKGRTTIIVGRAAFDSPQVLAGVVLTELIRAHQLTRGLDPHDQVNYHLAASAKEAISLLTHQTKAQIAGVDWAAPQVDDGAAPQHIVHFCNEYKGRGEGWQGNEFGGVAGAATDIAKAQAAAGRKVVYVSREPLPKAGAGEPTRRDRVIQINDNLTLILTGLPEGATRELFDRNENEFFELVNAAEKRAYDTWLAADRERAESENRDPFTPELIHTHDWPGTRGAMEIASELREQGHQLAVLSFVHGTHAAEHKGLITKPNIQHDEIDRIQHADAVVIAASKMIPVVDHLTNYRLHPSRFRVIPLICDVAHWAVDPATIDRDQAFTGLLGPDHGITDGDEIILAAGRVIYQKGPEEIIEAMRSFGRPNTKLVLAGAIDDDYRAELQEKIDAAGLTGRVLMSGRYQLADLINFSAFAHIAIQATHSESFNLTAVEMAATGVPLIGTAESAIIADNDGVALVIPVRDPAAINNAVQDIRTNPDAAAERARTARETALGTTYRASHIVEQYDEIYQDHMAVATQPITPVDLPTSNYFDSVRVHFLGTKADYPAAGATLTLTHGPGTANPTTETGRAPDGTDEHGPYWDVYLTGEGEEGPVTANLAINNNGETVPLTLDTVHGRAITGRQLHVHKTITGAYHLDARGAALTAHLNPAARSDGRLFSSRSPRSNRSAADDPSTVPQTEAVARALAAIVAPDFDMSAVEIVMIEDAAEIAALDARGLCAELVVQRYLYDGTLQLRIAPASAAYWKTYAFVLGEEIEHCRQLLAGRNPGNTPAADLEAEARAAGEPAIRRLEANLPQLEDLARRYGGVDHRGVIIDLDERPSWPTPQALTDLAARHNGQSPRITNFRPTDAELAKVTADQFASLNPQWQQVAVAQLLLAGPAERDRATAPRTGSRDPGLEDLWDAESRVAEHLVADIPGVVAAERIGTDGWFRVTFTTGAQKVIGVHRGTPANGLAEFTPIGEHGYLVAIAGNIGTRTDDGNIGALEVEQVAELFEGEVAAITAQQTDGRVVGARERDVAERRLEKVGVAGLIALRDHPSFLFPERIDELRDLIVRARVELQDPSPDPAAIAAAGAALAHLAEHLGMLVYDNDPLVAALDQIVDAGRDLAQLGVSAANVRDSLRPGHEVHPSIKSLDDHRVTTRARVKARQLEQWRRSHAPVAAWRRWDRISLGPVARFRGTQARKRQLATFIADHALTGAAQQHLLRASGDTDVAELAGRRGPARRATPPAPVRHRLDGPTLLRLDDPATLPAVLEQAIGRSGNVTVAVDPSWVAASPVTAKMCTEEIERLAGTGVVVNAGEPGRVRVVVDLQLAELLRAHPEYAELLRDPVLARLLRNHHLVAVVDDADALPARAASLNIAAGELAETPTTIRLAAALAQLTRLTTIGRHDPDRQSRLESCATDIANTVQEIRTLAGAATTETVTTLTGLLDLAGFLDDPALLRQVQAVRATLRQIGDLTDSPRVSELTDATARLSQLCRTSNGLVEQLRRAVDADTDLPDDRKTALRQRADLSTDAVRQLEQLAQVTEGAQETGQLASLVVDPALADLVRELVELARDPELAAVLSGDTIIPFGGVDVLRVPEDDHAILRDGLPVAEQ